MVGLTSSCALRYADGRSSRGWSSIAAWRRRRGGWRLQSGIGERRVPGAKYNYADARWRWEGADAGDLQEARRRLLLRRQFPSHIRSWLPSSLARLGRNRSNRTWKASNGLFLQNCGGSSGKDSSENARRHDPTDEQALRADLLHTIGRSKADVGIDLVAGPTPPAATCEKQLAKASKRQIVLYAAASPTRPMGHYIFMLRQQR